VATHYRGWIPTITGQLSFSHFGKCEVYATRSVNRADPNKRFLVSSQQRSTWDVLVPFRRHLGEFFTGLKGQLHFVCYAETKPTADPADNQGMLVGRVFIIQTGARWDQAVSPELDRTVDELNAYAYSATAVPIAEHFDHRLATLDAICTVNCAFQGSFHLKRSGVIDVFIDEHVKTAPDAPRFPEDELPRRHVRHILAAQLFSFIRDIGHQHQHHNPKTDTIVDLYEFPDGDDLTWRKHTLYGIYRRIISYKRRAVVDHQLMSLGLLAYAKAFRNVCAAEKIDGLPQYNDDETRESIMATEARVRHAEQKRQDRIGVVRTVGFGLAALIVSIAGLVKLGAGDQPQITVAPELVWFTKAVTEHPLALITVLATLFYSARVLFAGKAHPERGPASRILQAWLQPYSRIVGVLIRLATALVFLGFALALVMWRILH
jgi:hypothetical protein